MLHRQKENPRAEIIGSAMIHPTRSGLKITDHDDVALELCRNIRSGKIARIEGYEQSITPTERSGPYHIGYGMSTSLDDQTTLDGLLRELLNQTHQTQEIGALTA